VRGLFLRIFVAMWIAMTLAGAGFALVYATDETAERGRRRGFGHEGLRMLGEFSRLRVESGRGEEARRDLVRVATRSNVRVFVIDDGRLVVGAAAPDAATLDAARRAEASHTTVEFDDPHTSFHTVVVPLRKGAIATRFPPRPSRAEMILGAPETLPQKLAVVFLAIGIVAYLLARYLTRPLGVLRSAAQRLADGDLAVRVSPALDGATDEIAALGHDFDRMAERIAALLEGQERLLRDVSHELRSPLARLNVALALARKRLGEAPSTELDRIEREAERLAEMIGQILAVARLADDAPVSDTTVDLATVLEDVVRDADYEARGRDRSVEVQVHARPLVRGDEHAVHSAIENVVRNAVAFTEAHTAVVVTLDMSDGRAVVRVRDRGPGVPDDAIAAIFRPFYRVGTDRDRRTGGTGLGLAIAARVVARHEGEISARNVEDGGLEITVTLPVPSGRVSNAPART
jgi:signal transduction histidine kinase